MIQLRNVCHGSGSWRSRRQANFHILSSMIRQWNHLFVVPSITRDLPSKCFAVFVPMSSSYLFACNIKAINRKGQNKKETFDQFCCKEFGWEKDKFRIHIILIFIKIKTVKGIEIQIRKKNPLLSMALKIIFFRKKDNVFIIRNFTIWNVQHSK